MQVARNKKNQDIEGYRGTQYLFILDSVTHKRQVLLMPRLARIVVPWMPHHVTQRGNRRQQTFFCDDDYRAYLALLPE